MIRNVPTVDELKDAAQRYHNAKQAAGALGIALNSLYRLFSKHGIEPRWKKKVHARHPIKEAEGFGDTRVFDVGEAQVWLSSGVVSCARCSLPLQAMSGSCPHARALKRWLKAEEAGNE